MTVVLKFVSKLIVHNFEILQAFRKFDFRPLSVTCSGYVCGSTNTGEYLLYSIPGVELATFRSQVRRASHYTTQAKQE